jgi:hypothetical protein
MRKGLRAEKITKACKGGSYRQREQRQEQEQANKPCGELGLVNQPVMDGVQRKFQTIGNAQFIEDIM